ncbi:MAG: HAD family hydrolase [Myxococcota bacterium]
MLPFAASIDTVLFDFDGTLVDASDAICESFRAALLPDGPEVADERIRSMIGRPLREMFLVVRPDASERDVDDLVSRYRDVFLPLSATASAPLPGARALIDGLLGTKRLGIVTTRLSDGAVRMLRAHGMLDAFGCIIGLEHVERAKPDPQPIERALQRLGSSAERALMVGDTPDDIHAGRLAGTATVGVTTGAYDQGDLEAAGADLVVDSLSKLLPLLRV